VLKKTGPKKTIEEMVDLIKTTFNDQSGIVYCLSRNECEDVASKFAVRLVLIICFFAFSFV
jgi:superfamily II DNA helicase RecQ